MSLRPLYRDIDCLRAAGARIEGERGYGYRLIEDSTPPPQTLERIEIEALADAAASVMAKVAATLQADRDRDLFHAVSTVYRPEGPYPPSGDLALVRQACWQEETLAVRYRDEHGAETERTVLPPAIVCAERRLVELAWCRLREALRMFRMDRIVEAHTDGTRFRPHRASLLRTCLGELSRSAKRPRREAGHAP